MQIKIVFFSLIASLFVSVQAANILVNDQDLKLHGYIPNGWVFYSEDDSTRSMVDTSSEQKYKALLYITRYSLNGQTPAEWTRSFFIAQKISYDYSQYSFSSVIYYDSSANSKHQSAWAPQQYARCYSADTIDMAWDEYIYFTAMNGYGYEFLALGDTTDMKENIGDYMDILHGIIIDNGLSESSNFLLSDLQSEPQIPFTPTFSPSIGTYSATIGVDISRITFTPTADQNNSVISINNSTVLSGQKSLSQNLSIGNNTVKIMVVAQDGTSVKTYSFLINRLSTNIAVKRPLSRGQIKTNSTPIIFNLCGKKISKHNNAGLKPIVPGIYIYNNAMKENAEKRIFTR